MKPFVYLIYTATFLILLASSPANAQGLWGKKKQFFFRFSSSIVSYDALLFHGNETHELSQPLTDLTYRLFVEYAVSERVSLNVVLPYKQYWVAQADSSGNAPYLQPGYFDGPGNFEVGVRSKILVKNNSSLIAYLQVQFPTVYKDYSRGLSTGYDVMSFTPGFIFAKSWPRFLSYVASEVSLRELQYSTTIRFQGEFAYEILPNFWCAGAADWVSSFKNGYLAPSILQLQTGSYVNDQEFVAFGLKAFYKIRPMAAVEASLMKVVWGHLIAKSPAFNVGLAWTW
jgi:hypothetical protein